MHSPLYSFIFYNIKPLLEAEREKARNQMIPKLSDLLERAWKTNKFMMFDLNVPPPKHPFRKMFIHHIVHVILTLQLSNIWYVYLSIYGRGWEVDSMSQKYTVKLTLSYRSSLGS